MDRARRHEPEDDGLSVGYWSDPYDDLGASGTSHASFSPHFYVIICHHMLYIRRMSCS
jgi:hypothetical protein